MPQQTIHRGLRKTVFAPWLAPGSYGTDYGVRGARNMGVNLTVETDELRGDDVVLDRYTKIIAVEVAIEIATIDLELFDMILGGDMVFNDDYYNWEFGENDEIPYVGIAGRIVGSSAEADLHIQIAKARVNNNFVLAAQVGTYLLPTASFQGIDDNGVIARLRNFTAPTALELPLRTATGGFA